MQALGLGRARLGAEDLENRGLPRVVGLPPGPACNEACGPLRDAGAEPAQLLERGLGGADEARRSLGRGAGHVNPVEGEGVEVHVQVEAAAEALDERDAAAAGAIAGLGEGALQLEELLSEEPQQARFELRVACDAHVEVGRQGEDVLPQRDVREHMVDEVRGGLGRAPGGAAGAERAVLAGKGDEALLLALRAADADEAFGQNAAVEVAAQGAADVARGVARGEECAQVLADDPVQRDLTGLAAAVGRRDAGAGGGGHGRSPKASGGPPTSATEIPVS